ncbi:tail fiber domain-containing protein [Emticicia sp. C21]|uniref:tail fiber domain-containing protein n=1 Tax=Emticicia sp. C21 TaxID=2302915 RepID=UPI000E347937|nr:tail fiber domain-containing protein [Emticicia sp. C21]RFS16067.1 hypothetical protein D0T08_14350 [Emticicia sp. C21]
MEQFYKRLTFLILFFNTITSLSFAQIFAATGENQSITITPQGIQGKFPNSTETTNVALGRGALKSVTTGKNNTAIGDKALFNNDESNNTACGYFALFANTTGVLNSAFGANALENNTTGYGNAAIGAYSLNSNISLSKNVAIGAYALFSQSYAGTVSENTAIGHSALYSNNPTDAYNGRQNTAIGNGALYSNTTGANNIAIGYQALYSAKQNDNNVAIGYKALWSNIIGSRNVAIGNEALLNNNGSGNVAIGYRAGYNASGDDKLYIANSETDTPLIGGDFGAQKLAINMNLTLVGPNDFRTRTEALQVGGQAFKTLGNGNWKFVSDRRLKKNITYLNKDEMLEKLLLMQGVTYELKDENNKEFHYGFIAQDLLKIFPTKIKENAAGYLSADYGSYDSILIEAIKAINENVEDLKKDIPAKEVLYKQTMLLAENLEKRTQQLNK